LFVRKQDSMRTRDSDCVGVVAFRRSKLEILTDILILCKSPKLKSRIFQRVNLSYSNLQSCLLDLEKLGLIIASQESTYLTTERGLVFLDRWWQLQELLMPEEKMSLRIEKLNDKRITLFPYNKNCKLRRYL
jgi:predicted transcriptional regulator